MTRELFYERMFPVISQEPAYDFDAVADVAQRFWPAERIPGRRLESAGSVHLPNTPHLRAVVRERQNLVNTTVAEVIQLSAELEALASMIDVDR